MELVGGHVSESFFFIILIFSVLCVKHFLNCSLMYRGPVHCGQWHSEASVPNLCTKANWAS